MAKPTKRSIEIYTFKEGTHWIAAWRRFDLVAQGDTAVGAIEMLQKVIANTAIWAAIDGNLPTFGNCSPPPEGVRKQWAVLDRANRKKGKK
jgi:hypothetical protein